LVTALGVTAAFPGIPTMVRTAHAMGILMNGLRRLCGFFSGAVIHVLVGAPQSLFFYSWRAPGEGARHGQF
jgi:hypothetical protein